MTITTFSSRELNQDISKAKKAAEKGPVFITDRGKPAHVLLSIEEYRRITGQGGNLVERLAMREGSEISLEPPRATDLARPASFD